MVRGVGEHWQMYSGVIGDLEERVAVKIYVPERGPLAARDDAALTKIHAAG